MNDAVRLIESLIEITNFLSKTTKLSAIDKVLYCINSGTNTPRGIMEKLNISKGNLANYCKHLIHCDKIKKNREYNSREISYTITERGKASIQKILTAIESASKNKNFTYIFK